MYICAGGGGRRRQSPPPPPDFSWDPVILPTPEDPSAALIPAVFYIQVIRLMFSAMALPTGIVYRNLPSIVMVARIDCTASTGRLHTTGYSPAYTQGVFLDNSNSVRVSGGQGKGRFQWRAQAAVHAPAAAQDTLGPPCMRTTLALKRLLCPMHAAMQNLASRCSYNRASMAGSRVVTQVSGWLGVTARGRVSQLNVAAGCPMQL